MFTGPGSAPPSAAGRCWGRHRSGTKPVPSLGTWLGEAEGRCRSVSPPSTLGLRRSRVAGVAAQGALFRGAVRGQGARWVCAGAPAPNGEGPAATEPSTRASLRLDAGEVSRRAALPAAVLDAEGIERVLPHRYPFLLVDKVLEYVPEERVVAVKNVSYNEAFFQGHFPTTKIMPGVLQLEALAQCCGLMLLEPPESGTQSIFLFASVEGLRWRRPVRPGDVLIMECEVLALRKRFGIAKCRGQGYVDGELVVEADMTFACSK